MAIHHHHQHQRGSGRPPPNGVPPHVLIAIIFAFLLAGLFLVFAFGADVMAALREIAHLARGPGYPTGNPYLGIYALLALGIVLVCVIRLLKR